MQILIKLYHHVQKTNSFTYTLLKITTWKYVSVTNFYKYYYELNCRYDIKNFCTIDKVF